MEQNTEQTQSEHAEATVSASSASAVPTTRDSGFEGASANALPQRPAREPREARSARDEGIVYVGKKPLMTYVLAVVTQFNAGNASVKIKARGKAISRVIDVTQVVKNRFMQSLRIANFEATTEIMPNEDGTTSKVSSLTLTLSK